MPRGPIARAAGKAAPGARYLEEDGIPADSTTDTSFAAIKLFKWTRAAEPGVPFYLRAGKRLSSASQIAVIFKRSAHVPFSSSALKRVCSERARHPRPIG